MPMKRLRFKIVAAIIVSPIAIMLLWCINTCRSKQPPFPEGLLQKTKVDIIAIDDTYDIHIRIGGRLFMPITAEGPFPEWSADTRMITEGEGENVNHDGKTYIKYTIGKNLRCEYNRLSSGNIWISEKTNTLIVDVVLNEASKGLMNQSGEYKNINIEHPPVIPLAIDTPINSLDGQYVRARGHFIEKEDRFEAAGRSFTDSYAPQGCKETDLFEVIGIVHTYDWRQRGEPHLQIFTCKKIIEKQEP
jgi:hypothetical protein